MTRKLDLFTETNWHLMYSVSIPPVIIASSGDKKYYAEITPIRPNIILDKSILGISVNTIIPTGKKWLYAGSVFRFTNSIFGQLYIEDRKPLFLNRFNLLIFDNLSNSYQLELYVPRWFISYNLTIYQYEGDYQENFENNLDNRLNKIEEKIDDISSFN